MQKKRSQKKDSLIVRSVLHCCTETDSNSATASRSRRGTGHQHGGLPTAEQEQAEYRTVSQLQQSGNSTVALHQHLHQEPSTPSADHLLRDCGSALDREENPDQKSMDSMEKNL